MTDADEPLDELLHRVLDHLEGGEEHMQGGVDYRGPEAVGGHERVWYAEGAFHHETVDFHELGGRRDHETRSARTLTRDAMRAFLSERPDLLRTMQARWPRR